MFMMSNAPDHINSPCNMTQVLRFDITNYMKVIHVGMMYLIMIDDVHNIFQRVFGDWAFDDRELSPIS